MGNPKLGLKAPVSGEEQARPSLYAMKRQQTGGGVGPLGRKEGVSINSQPLRVAVVGRVGRGC